MRFSKGPTVLEPPVGPRIRKNKKIGGGEFICAPRAKQGIVLLDRFKRFNSSKSQPLQTTNTLIAQTLSRSANCKCGVFFLIMCIFIFLSMYVSI